MKVLFPAESLSLLERVDFSAAKSVKLTYGEPMASIEYDDEDSLEIKLSMAETISLIGVDDNGRVNKSGLALEYIYDEIILAEKERK